MPTRESICAYFRDCPDFPSRSLFLYLHARLGGSLDDSVKANSPIKQGAKTL